MSRVTIPIKPSFNVMASDYGPPCDDVLNRTATSLLALLTEVRRPQQFGAPTCHDLSEVMNCSPLITHDFAEVMSSEHRSRWTCFALSVWPPVTSRPRDLQHAPWHGEASATAVQRRQSRQVPAGAARWASGLLIAPPHQARTRARVDPPRVNRRRGAASPSRVGCRSLRSRARCRQAA